MIFPWSRAHCEKTAKKVIQIDVYHICSNYWSSGKQWKRWYISARSSNARSFLLWGYHESDAKCVQKQGDHENCFICKFYILFWDFVYWLVCSLVRDAQGSLVTKSSITNSQTIKKYRSDKRTHIYRVTIRIKPHFYVDLKGLAHQIFNCCLYVSLKNYFFLLIFLFIKIFNW